MLFVAFLSLARSVAASAQPSNTIPTELNLDVPSAPALDILGISASKAASPVNLQQFAATSINAYDAHGVPTQGIAWTENPSQLHLQSAIVDLDEYLKSSNFLKRAWYNTDFSLGIAKGANDPEAVSKWAAAVSIPLVNHTDWRSERDLRRKFTNALTKLTPAEQVPDVSEVPKASNIAELRAVVGSFHAELLGILKPSAAGEPTLDPGLLVAAKTANDNVETWQRSYSAGDVEFKDALAAFVANVQNSLTEVRTANNALLKDRMTKIGNVIQTLSNASWNRFSISLAGGAGQTSTTSSFDTTGHSEWGTVGVPIGPFGGLVSVRYFNRISMSVGSMKTAAPLDGYTLASRVRGGNSSWHGFLEYQYTEAQPNAGTKAFDHILQAGVEVKLGGQWLQLGFGKDLANSHTILGLNFSFTVASSAALSTGG